MKIIQEEFKSLRELVNVIEERPVNKIFADKELSSEEGSYNFTKTNSYEEARELMLGGYKDIVNEIGAGVYKSTADHRDLYNRRRVSTGVVGYAPHVPNAILGLPNSMIYMKNEPVKVKTLDICYDACENAKIDADDFIKAGKVILQIINSMEMEGIRVKLRVAFYCGVDSSIGPLEHVFATVKLKDYRDQIDIAKMCFPFAHPSMLRRIGFKWMETQPDVESIQWAFGYGSNRDPDEELKKKILNPKEKLVTLKNIKNHNFDVEEIKEKFFK